MAFFFRSVIFQSLCVSAWAAVIINNVGTSSKFSNSSLGNPIRPFPPISKLNYGILAASSNPDSCSGSSSLQDFCPRCNDQGIDYGEVGHYSVQCDMVYTNVTYYDNVHNATVEECIEACMKVEGCYSPVISPGGKCLLATGNRDPPLATEAGYAVLEPRFDGLRPNPSGTGTSATTAKANGACRPAPTLKARRTSRCHAEDISCPHCHDAHVQDALGNTYHVFCNHDLYSESSYSPQEWLTPDGCMAMCDNFTWCGGATFWPEGNCELAKGEDVFPKSKHGFTAFLPVNLSYTAPPEQLSAYPTGPFTSPSRPSKTHIGISTSGKHPSITHPHSATPSSQCDPNNVTCPECNFLRLTDGFNEPYTVRCDVKPKCGDVSTRVGYTERDSCLVYCDTDPTCRAAIIENGECSLCENTLDDVYLYVSQDECVVFIADSAF